MFKNKKKYNSLSKEIILEFNCIRDKSKRSRLCHIPFKSMFFSENGEVHACCYYHKKPYGKYPENTIYEIWTGSNIKKLRENIKHNDLPVGCDDCRIFLERRNYYSVGAWKYDYLPKAKKKYPVSLDFQASSVCNLECIMCSGEFSTAIRRNREVNVPYKSPYDAAFVKQLETFIPHLKEAAFTGGEPFLIDIYYDIWRKMIEINPNIRISISTNGTILNQRVKTILDKLQANIILSIDSVHKDNFEKIRKNADFNVVMYNLEFFKHYTNEKKTNLTVTICPMRQNWQELPDIIKFMNEKDITAIFNNVFYPPYCSLWNMDPAMQKEIIEYLKSFSFNCITTTQQNNVARFKNLIKQIDNWRKESVKSGYEKILTITDTNKLKKIFYDKLAYSIQNDPTIAENEKNRTLNKYIQVFDHALISSGNDEIIGTVLKYFISYPIENILSEIQNRTSEQLTERIRQAAGYQ